MTHDSTSRSAPETPTPAEGPAWGPWLAWGWVALLTLIVVAEVGGFENLRLALDLQRAF